MKRRAFTLAGFFGAIGASIGKALGYDGAPQKPLSKIMPEGIGKFIDTTTGVDGKYSIKVGRKIMILPHGVMGSGGWQVYADTARTALHSHQAADVKEAVDQAMYEFYQQRVGPNMLSPPLPRERLAVAPPEIKRWSEAPGAVKPMIGGTQLDLKFLLLDLEDMRYMDLPELHLAVHMLHAKVRSTLERQESFCNGHNGPALGLTAYHTMTDMGDGRRLCPYCYNQEINDGRSTVTS